MFESGKAYTTVPEASKSLGFGKTRFGKLIAKGILKGVHCMGVFFIDVESLENYASQEGLIYLGPGMRYQYRTVEVKAIYVAAGPEKLEPPPFYQN